MRSTTVDGLGQVGVVDSPDDRKTTFRPEFVTFVADVADEGEGEKEVTDEVAEDRGFLWIEILVINTTGMNR
jgi:hypothetical protein